MKEDGGMAKTYTASTGRDAITGYDAAGNIVTDRVQTIPTVFNRTMKYDAAGRQVETFDPALRPCCEVDQTSTNHYDGNGWLVKGEGFSTAFNSETYNLRSTVLGGETVGTMGTQNGSSVVNKGFTAPVIGGKLQYSGQFTYPYASFSRVGPEGLFEYGADQAGKAFDPRGADTGLDDPSTTGGSGSGGYPGGGSDPQNYGRCVEGGVPMPCDMQAKFENAFNRIQDAINADSKKGGGSTPDKGPGGSKIDKSKYDDPSGRKTSVTNKLEADPDDTGTVDPSDLPDGCKFVDGVLICPNGPSAGVEIKDDPPLVDASVSQSSNSSIEDRTQLPKCLRDFLRPFFPNVQIGNWKVISPVDDARFISGLPAYVNGNSTSAITLGLYDIHYDSGQVDLTGGSDNNSIGTIAEEIAHTVQFIGVWEQVENNTGRPGAYLRAQDSWKLSYLAESAKIAAANVAKGVLKITTGIGIKQKNTYSDNKYEKEAQATRRTVQEAADGLAKSPCYP